MPDARAGGPAALKADAPRTSDTSHPGVRINPLTPRINTRG